MHTRGIVMSSLIVLIGANGACSSEPNGGPTIRYATSGPIAGPAGEGHFTFGAATAAMQIEEDQPESDWHYFTAPTSAGTEATYGPSKRPSSTARTAPSAEPRTTGEPS